MTADNIRYQIRDALSAVPDADFPAVATGLLAVLGYRSERTLELSGGAEEFFQAFPAQTRSAETERAFCEHVSSVQLIFQLTSEEIGVTNQANLFDGDNTFDEGRQQSFMFFAVELKDASYARGRYADFTREINKRLNQPSVVLFKTADNLLTLSFIHRRQHKRDTTRDVLGQVSLIREINPANPYRSHLEILTELSLAECADWMGAHNKPLNFDGLLAAWLNKLDTEQLNRRFYRELFVWFNRAVSEAHFPTDQARTVSGEEHVIRLITRLLFVWFIKEKGLIASDLFVEEQITGLIKDYCRETGDSYYRVVLQNLFFATLNTEITKRGFSKERRSTHRNFSLYRFKREMIDPDALRALFDLTPFINGGLFDCLDTEEAPGEGGYRIDCFTDNVTNPRKERDYGILSVPNCLFFDDNGLFPMLNHYKFTVEENTPIEQEVALDPELLGKVFENLLAAYNPETKDTVRKQTGSYYTPREVVDYMVEEALIVTLGETAYPDDGDTKFWQERLRYLLDYADAFSDADELFEEKEKERIVRAIADLKVLDPAVGSGAFPMGVLHKLTLALQRLDPDNQRWEALQKERATKKAGEAFDIRDKKVRKEELDQISETFERYSGDFGRKLYLVQNSIFGVDIQPVACQIAKLRFFISLAIEQEPDPNTDNFGIKPLPNLETRFVAADTLLGVKDADQLDLFRQQIEALKTKLAENRERHFHSTTRRKKLDCRRQDKKLREELSESLHSAGLPEDDAKKIAEWDPYDQNAKADWFGAEYMFGITDGFDIVIGNPPYIQLQKNDGELGKRYKNAGYETFASAGDIYQLFYEKGCLLLQPNRGLLAYITSNSWLKAKYGKALRRYFAERHTPLRLLEMGKDVFENAIVDTNILILSKRKSNTVGKAVDMDHLSNKKFPPDASSWNELHLQSDKPWMSLSVLEKSIMEKMEAIGTPLKEWDISINYGIKTGYNDAFIIDNETKEALIKQDPRSAKIFKPVLRGRDIQRYRANWDQKWLIYARKGTSIENYETVFSHLKTHKSKLIKKIGGNKWYELQASPSDDIDLQFNKNEKLLWMDLTDRGRFAYDDEKMYCINTVYMMTGNSLKFLCALLNSSLVTWFMHKYAASSGMGVTRWFEIYVRNIPIPEVTVVEQEPLVNLVDKIITSTGGSDASDLQARIDCLVCKLYHLTQEEMAYINS